MKRNDKKKCSLVGDLAIDHDFKIEFRMLRVARVNLDRRPYTKVREVYPTERGTRTHHL